MTLMISHPDCLAHVNPPRHPEQVARLENVLRMLDDLPLSRADAPLASDADLLRVHDRAYIDHIRQSAPETGSVRLDPDTHMSPGSLTAALRAAGAALRAVDAVMAGEAANAFCATRPPGHHAERGRSMGFCLFGNVALAAKHALDHHGLARVAIVDFDVHHGNGTQDLVEGDSRILFVSSHQVPLWPDTGLENHDNTINVPLAPGSGGAQARAALAPALAAIAEHDPQMILVSAGFDAHADDPIGGLTWTESDYVQLTDALCDLADAHCGGKLVSVLEGGYDIDALGRAARAHVETLIRRSVR